jgi:hypothetical protein
MFRSSHFWFLVSGRFWRQSYKNTKMLRNLCLHLQSKMGKTEKRKENHHPTKVTKKTRDEKMG